MFLFWSIPKKQCVFQIKGGAFSIALSISWCAKAMPRFYKQCVSPDSSCICVIVIHNVIGQGRRDTTMHGCRSWRLYKSDQMCGTVERARCKFDTVLQKNTTAGQQQKKLLLCSINEHSQQSYTPQRVLVQTGRELVLVDLFERNCSAEATKNSSVCVIDTFSLRVLWPFISLIEPSPDQGSTEVTPLPPERRT